MWPPGPPGSSAYDSSASIMGCGSTPYVGMRYDTTLSQCKPILSPFTSEGHRTGPERKIITHLNHTLTKTFTLAFHFVKFILFYDIWLFMLNRINFSQIAAQQNPTTLVSYCHSKSTETSDTKNLC